MLGISERVYYGSTARHQTEFVEAVACPISVYGYWWHVCLAYFLHQRRDFSQIEADTFLFDIWSAGMADIQAHLSIQRLFHLFCGVHWLLYLVRFLC